MLRTKCILWPSTNSDGLRISVMSRHTLLGGIMPDQISVMSRHTLLGGIMPDQHIWPYDLWLKDLAPPDKLIGSFHRGEITFSQYNDLYLKHLQKELCVLIIKEVTRYALHKRVSLLCVELNPILCHRSTLPYECFRYEPELHIQNF